MITVAAAVVALAASACGTEHVQVPKTDTTYASDQSAAELFNQRCGGCHTLSVAGTQGSGSNPRTNLAITGPNFNVRCERPANRVLYAIINGGFSGAYMPQNIVVGPQAREVANFVAKYAGSKAPKEPGIEVCAAKPIGALPLTGSLTASGT